MTSIILALAPLFVILMVGHRLRVSGFVADGFWSNLEKLTYWALLPALFLKTMAEADFTGMTFGPVLLAAVGLLGIGTGLLVLVRPLARHTDGPTYSSIIQGGTRFNNYVGLPVTLSLFGHDGLVVYAVIISVLIPLTNVTSVWALSHYATHERLRWGNLFYKIATNPLILSTLLGIGLSVGGIGLVPVVDQVVTAFANASLLMGLLAIGAKLSLSAVRSEKGRVLFTCLAKLVIFPLIALGLGVWLDLSHLHISVLVLFASLPTATSSYILAGQMGGNTTIMANIVATETLLAFLSMPAMLWLMLEFFPI